jgi:hypothetical protein
MKDYVKDYIIAIVIFVIAVLFSLRADATTIGPAMNVSGQGSNYIFVYRGNNQAEFDALATIGINNLSGWLASCTSPECSGTTYIVDHATLNGDFLYLYTSDGNGNIAWPDSGRYYSFNNPPVTTVTNSQGSSLSMTTGPGTSVITQGQQVKITLHQNYTAPNKLIHIDQIGDNNIITIDQKGHGEINLTMQGNTNTTNINQGGIGIGQNQIKMNTLGDTNTVSVNQGRSANGTPAGSNGHYAETDIVGTNNSMTLQQNNTGGVGGHFMSTSIYGNQNSIVAKQNDNGNKIMFIDVSGNSNVADIVQKGTGQHYLDLKMNGAQNNAQIVQEGTQPNKATIDMTRGLGGPNNLDLIQSSTTNPLSINLLQTCTNLAGCGTVIIRQN